MAAVGEPVYVHHVATQIYRPSSTFSKTSDTTLEAVPGMSFPVVSGGSYEAQLMLAITGNDSGGGKVDWDFSGGHEIRRWIIGPAVGATNNMDTNATLPRRDGATDQSFGIGSGSGSGSTTYLEFIFIVAASDDTITLRFAQNSSNSTASTISTASVLLVRRIA